MRGSCQEAGGASVLAATQGGAVPTSTRVALRSGDFPKGFFAGKCEGGGDGCGRILRTCEQSLGGVASNSGKVCKYTVGVGTYYYHRQRGREELPLMGGRAERCWKPRRTRSNTT